MKERQPLLKQNKRHPIDRVQERWYDSLSPGLQAQTPMLRARGYLLDKVKKGSIKASIFTLITATIGAGLLSIPFAVEQSGLGLGTLIVILASIFSFFSLHLLIVCRDFFFGYLLYLFYSREESGRTSYSYLALVSFGRKMAIFTKSIVSLNVFGSLVAYTVAASTLIPYFVKIALFQLYGTDESENLIFKVLTDKNALVFIVVLTIIPLCLMKQVGSLRFASLFAILGTIYLTVVVVVKYFEYCREGMTPCLAEALQNHKNWYKFSYKGILTTVPITFYSFTCHPNVLPIFIELQKPSLARMYKVVRRSLMITLAIYLTIGSFVYLTFLSATRGNFLTNDYKKDIWIGIGTALFSFSILFAIPLLVHAGRENLYQLLSSHPKEHIPDSWHYSLTAAMLILDIVISIAATDLSQVLGLLGSTTNPIICFILPALFFIRITKSEGYQTQRVIAWIMVISMIIFSALSVVNQVLIYSGYRKN